MHPSRIVPAHRLRAEAAAAPKKAPRKPPKAKVGRLKEKGQ